MVGSSQEDWLVLMLSVVPVTAEDDEDAEEDEDEDEDVAVSSGPSVQTHCRRRFLRPATGVCAKESSLSESESEESRLSPIRCFLRRESSLAVDEAGELGWSVSVGEGDRPLAEPWSDGNEVVEPVEASDSSVEEAYEGSGTNESSKSE